MATIYVARITPREPDVDVAMAAAPTSTRATGRTRTPTVNPWGPPIPRQAGAVEASREHRFVMLMFYIVDILWPPTPTILIGMF